MRFRLVLAELAVTVYSVTDAIQYGGMFKWLLATFFGVNTLLDIVYDDHSN